MKTIKIQPPIIEVPKGVYCGICRFGHFTTACCHLFGIRLNADRDGKLVKCYACLAACTEAKEKEANARTRIAAHIDNCLDPEDHFGRALGEALGESSEKGSEESHEDTCGEEKRTCATCRHYSPSSGLSPCRHPRMAAYIFGDLDPKDAFGCILWEG